MHFEINRAKQTNILYYPKYHNKYSEGKILIKLSAVSAKTPNRFKSFSCLFVLRGLKLHQKTSDFLNQNF